MTPREIAAARHAQLLSAMEPLLGDPRFDEFLKAVKELKEQAVELAIGHDTVKSDRATLASLGEIRAYVAILDIAENHRMQIEMEQDRRIEEHASAHES